MKLRDNKGSITIFVLVGLLFMSAFLLLSYGSNVNKSKTAKEMFNMVSNIYSYNDGDENAYMRVYTALRNQNAQEMSSSNDGQEDTSTLELTKTFYGPISNYTIYGNSVQDTATYGTPSPDNPVEIQSVGDLVTDTEDENYGKYKIPVKVSGKNLVNIPNMNIKLEGAYYQNYFPQNPSLMLQPNTKYTVSFNYMINSTTATVKCGIGYGTSYYAVDIVYGKSYPNQTQGKFEYTFTTPTEFSSAQTPYLQFRFVRAESAATADVDISNIQVELGEKATEYEQYRESQTINIYLDEPLRKVGTEKDYIDFSTGTLVRKIKELILDGDAGWWTYTYNNDYYTGLAVTGKLDNTYARISGLSNMSKYVGSYLDNTYENVLWLGVSNNSIYFVNTPYDADITSFKNKLNETPLKVYYASQNDLSPITIDLPELEAYEDYTKIEILTEVAPSKIEVTYDGYTFEK